MPDGNVTRKIVRSRDGHVCLAADLIVGYSIAPAWEDGSASDGRSVAIFALANGGGRHVIEVFDIYEGDRHYYAGMDATPEQKAAADAREEAAKIDAQQRALNVYEQLCADLRGWEP